MIDVALPDIQRAFDVSVTSTAWLVTLYLIAMAVGQPIGGRLGDTLGRRPVYLAGLGWFAAASLGAMFAPSLPWLVVFRLQQALAGTLVFPNGAALVREAIPVHRRGLAYGMVGLGWRFVERERHARNPILDLSLFRSAHFRAACASILLGNLVMYTTLLALPL